MSKNVINLPGLPLIHQPCFQDLWEFDNHSSEINDLAVNLNKDGFAVFDFPEPNFDKIVERLKNKIGSKFDWEKWQSGETGDLRIQDAYAFCKEVKEIATNKKTLEILSTLYGRRAFPFQTLNFGVGTQQANHSDHVHFHSIPERFMCAVWIALEDVDEQNGTLTYYPGSQNWIHLTNEHFCIDPGSMPKEKLYEDYPKFTDTWKMLAEYYDVEPKVVKLKKGQAVIWTANVVHAGGKILDKTRTRWSQVTHYYFDDCVYTTPLANNQAKGKIMMRDVSDIRTGKIITNKFCGIPLTDEEIQNTVPKIADLDNLFSILSQCKNSPYRNHKDIPKDFDASMYLKKNLDVLKSNTDPYEHYVKYGKSENRAI